jgi:hypothetical protein
MDLVTTTPRRSKLLSSLAVVSVILITACEDSTGPDGDDVTVSWSSAAQTSSEGVATVNVTAQLSDEANDAVTVPFTVSGTATAPGGYSVSVSSLTIPEGQTSATFPITVINDTTDEPNETVVVTMGTPTNATRGATTTHTLTIEDNDEAVPATPSVQWSATTQSSGEGVATVNLTVQLSAASTQDVTVPFTVSTSGTAATPADFTVSASPLVIPAGQLSRSITLTVVDDALDEANETVIVNLGTPTNATQGANTVHTLTIQDNDDAAAPNVSFTTIGQSNLESVTTVTVTAQLSGMSGQTVTVPFTVGAGTATSPADYTISASPITIAPGQLTGTATITVVDDTTDEPNETVIVNMGTPTNGSQGALTTHTVTIEDNDAAAALPTVSWSAATQTNLEGVTAVTVTAQLSAALPGQSVVNPFTVTGTAENPGDFTVSTSPLTIPAGQTSGTVTITVVNDAVDEPNETVIVTMGAPTNATAGATTVHTVTISNDDAAPGGPPTVSWSAASQTSAESVATVTVTAQLSGATNQPVTVPFLVGAGTATNPGDYTISASPLTIPAGQTTASLTITVVNDTTDEPNETVVVNMGLPVNATQGATTSHTVTITDDEAGPSVAFTAGSQTVAESGGTVTVTAQLSAATFQSVTVPFTVTGTATGSTDYVISNSPLTIAAGGTTASVTLTVMEDGTDEPDETVIVTMGVPTNATAGATAMHTVTITDNDP